eukprot:5712027-Pyramimonas_sp.AAC.1
MVKQAETPFHWRVGSIGNSPRHARRESPENAAKIERAIWQGAPLTAVLDLGEITPGDALGPRGDR